MQPIPNETAADIAMLRHLPGRAPAIITRLSPIDVPGILRHLTIVAAAL
jgi:hypothetical protein